MTIGSIAAYNVQSSLITPTQLGLNKVSSSTASADSNTTGNDAVKVTISDGGRAINVLHMAMEGRSAEDAALLKAADELADGLLKAEKEQPALYRMTEDKWGAANEYEASHMKEVAYPRADDALRKKVEDHLAARSAAMNSHMTTVGNNKNNLTNSPTANRIDTSRADTNQIQNSDFTNETMKLTKANILTQAKTAMMAQANQSPQAVLQLIS